MRQNKIWSGITDLEKYIDDMVPEVRYSCEMENPPAWILMIKTLITLIMLFDHSTFCAIHLKRYSSALIFISNKIGHFYE